MHRLVSFAGIVVLIAVLATSCGTKNSGVEESAYALPDSAETELESAEKYAKLAKAEGNLQKGDIIIVYDVETMAACCFECGGSSVKLMYNGDYKGSYSKLDCVFQKDYDLWSVMAYRLKHGAEADAASDEYDDLAQHIFDEYIEKYGDLRAGSFICFFCDGETVAQYATLSDGTVERIQENDVRYNMWKDSETSDDYWAKLVHDNADGLSWEIEEYDKQCSKAFDEIIDAIDIISEKMTVPNGSIFICDRGERQIAMEYFSDGSVRYVQSADISEEISILSKLDRSLFGNMPKSITVYTPEV